MPITKPSRRPSIERLISALDQFESWPDRDQPAMPTDHSRDQGEQGLNSLYALVGDGLASGPTTPDTQADWTELQAIAQGKIA